MTASGEEFFEIIDADDRVIDVAPRSRCHGDPSLIHRTAHVVVMDKQGRVLLQKRSTRKDIQPGKWDTAVGGHLAIGEDYETAARREAREELGLPEDLSLTFLFDMKIRNAVESENVRVFSTISEGPFHPQPEEIDAVRFWSEQEWRDALQTDQLTPNCAEELLMLARFLRRD